MRTSALREVACLAAAALALAAGPAAAQAVPGCRLQIDPLTTQWSVNAFDPFAGQPATREFEVAFQNIGDQVCDAGLRVDTRGEPFGLGNAKGQRLSYTLVDEHAGLDVTPTLGRSQQPLSGRRLRVEPGQRELARFSFAVDVKDLGSDGVFSQMVTLTTETREGTPVGARDVTLGLDVAPSAVVGLKGAFQRTSSGARIDLGELASGPVNLPIEVYVFSTRGYRLSAESKNKWRLNLAQDPAWGVPYSLSLGGRTLGSGAQTLDVRSPSGMRQDSYPMGVALGAVGDLRAGVYSDLITLSVAAL